jgi:error-prone DNA polymerase
LATLPAEDPEVYDMICRADTMGVFQIESRAQMSMLPRLKPRCFYDLVIEVAIVRPGPIQGDMVHPYLRRRAGLEPESYPSEAIREVLHKTLGVPLFQEQAMRLAVVAAGFTPGEADQLRRAMGAWRRPGVIDQFRRKLLEGMEARGLSREFAEQVFRQIRGFGEYGFPESHAASFALLVYASAWLKCHYPVVFTAALINSQPMGFYRPAQLIQELVNRGGRVLPLDVLSSDWDCTLEYREESGDGLEGSEDPGRSDRSIPDPRNLVPALRLGLRLIVGFSRAAARQITQARRQGPFRSVEDLQRRTDLGQSVIMQLADAGALDSLVGNRRAALWQALGQESRRRELPLFGDVALEESSGAGGGLAWGSELNWLPRMSEEEEVLADYRTSSLSLRGHPLAFYREALRQQGIRTISQLAEFEARESVRIAGLVLLRQRPGTAKGITFVTLEDETGAANLVVHPQVWERHDQVARRSPAWIAQGRVQSHEGVIHLVVQRLDDLAQRLRTARRMVQENPAHRNQRRFH